MKEELYRLPRNDSRVAALEDALAALDAADESARILALRTRRSADLMKAGQTRAGLARVWHFLAGERRKYWALPRPPASRLPPISAQPSTDLVALDAALAALDAADEAARVLALCAQHDADLIEADQIRAKLAQIWMFLEAERRRYAAPPTPPPPPA